MAKTDLKIKSTNAATGASITTSVTYVNPDANSATLKQFATKLNAFTTNSYAQADRVHTINVDTEDVQTTKPSPNLRVTNVDNNDKVKRLFISYDGTGTITAQAIRQSGGYYSTYPDYATEPTNINRICVYPYPPTGVTLSYPFTVYISISETDDYAAQTIEYVVNS